MIAPHTIRTFSSRFGAAMAGGLALGMIAALALAYATLVILAAASPTDGFAHAQNADLVVLIALNLLIVIVSVAIAFPLGISLASMIATRQQVPWVRALERALSVLVTMPTLLTGVAVIGWYLAIAELTGGEARHSFDAVWIILTMILAIMPRFALQVSRRLQPVLASCEDSARALGLTTQQMLLHLIIPSVISDIIAAVLKMTARAFGVTAPFLLLHIVGVGGDAGIPLFSLRSYETFAEANLRLTCLYIVISTTVMVMLSSTAHLISENSKRTHV